MLVSENISAGGTHEQAGRAYEHKRGSSDPVLTQVGPGTPGGELLRRYWQPIARSNEATTLPQQIRRFGEDLILFRNKNGQPGLLYPRCCHRGTTLLYGRVEDDGIRCCYHGWKFDNQGRCLEQPCEPNGGENRHKVRQPWYPVIDMWGAIWTYMGPPEKQPALPRFSILENPGEDEEVRVRSAKSAVGVYPYPIDFNWFQFWENIIDSYHVPILHFAMSGDQFSAAKMGVFPRVSWRKSDQGASVLACSERDNVETGEVYHRIAETMIPNRAALPNFFADGPAPSLLFIIPMDDTNFINFSFNIAKKGLPDEDWRAEIGVGPENKRWKDLTAEEHQRYPNDYEAQNGQGKVTLHSEEHLAQSDIGLAMLRRLYKQQCDIVAQGGTPIGASYDPNEI